ncbi:DUF1572 family protein [Chitinophaga sancti]|uniref:DUF1572 family protein n=1 Tax=Chitinophaga sancti TaxID=1004 RepID=A0A1K1RU61_9BACT|nr:DUF1572 family protein [Chitinophaga sancti]WQD62406.1 DUF1572 family protein [Chitinophaga sancti]WQG92025.1 DUF1572 family protein [Chitinophaga sancti]SFW75357.1 Protein of unknown function [Chitinophaga sancti]
MLGKIYLDSALERLSYYKSLGDKTIARLSDEQLLWQPEGEPNSIYLIVKHLSGNMRSRWTDFLSSDGEKEWRNRDEEFENGVASKAAIISLWNEGWQVILDAIGSLTPEDLEKQVLIRSEPHVVVDAINRQLMHVPYHVGQIVYLGKILQGEKWLSLSIPKGGSQAFNDRMMK